jgi:hypothetical protein
MGKAWLRLCPAVFALLLTGTAAQAAVTASVDRTRVYQDDILTLTIRADFPEANEPLDLTALNTLFTVEGQSQTTQSRYSTSQGQQRWREWRLQIQPRKVGTLAIPNFKLGDEQSSPIMITVMDPGDRPEGLPEQAVILSATLDTDNLYIGQSTILTINLDYQIQLQGNFDQLDLSEFNAEKLNEDNTQTTHAGQPYRRYQLVYRLTPEAEGTLTIPEIRFVGQYESGNYGQQMRMNRIHPRINVSVKPIPASYPADAVWLPAESVRLSDNLGSRVQAEVNEHLDWEVTSFIQGQPATQLPDPLASVDDSDFRLYRNSPEFNSTAGQQQRTDVAALVFSEPGEYSLPAVQVAWWDVTSDSLRYAQLPPRTVRVEGISNEAMDILTDPSLLNSEQSNSQAAGGQSGQPSTGSAAASVWPWISASLGIGWLATVLVFWASNRYLKRRLRESESKSPSLSGPVAGALDDMALAARSGDAAAWHGALLRWLRTEPGLTLRDVKNGLDEPERDLLDQLEGYLYASKPGDIDADADSLQTLHQAVKAVHGPHSESVNTDVMTLYP